MLFYILLNIYWILGSVQVPVFGAKCKCGHPSDNILSMRIVGGRRADPHSFPWAVAILKSDRMHCGGSLVTNKHVVSAGHCFRFENYTEMEALLGLDSLDDLRNVAKRKISDVVVHEEFTPNDIRDENDIAMMTLAEPVDFGETIVPICLPKPGKIFKDQTASVVGWGRKGTDKKSSRVLLRASLNLLSDEDCLKSKLAANLKPTMICAFSKGQDGCQGDSGGPLQVYEPDGKYVLVGIVSWGIGCANPDMPGVYTKVSRYIDWIEKHTPNGETCDRSVHACPKRHSRSWI